jgi:hypothetical protein
MEPEVPGLSNHVSVQIFAELSVRDLFICFSACGWVTHISLPNRTHPQGTGYYSVTFLTIQAAIAACGVHSHKGTGIQVRTTRSPFHGATFSASYVEGLVVELNPADYRSIATVTNIPQNAGPQDILTQFSSYGVVLGVGFLATNNRMETLVMFADDSALIRCIQAPPPSIQVQPFNRREAELGRSNLSQKPTYRKVEHLPPHRDHRNEEWYKLFAEVF